MTKKLILDIVDQIFISSGTIAKKHSLIGKWHIKGQDHIFII
jgi:hypothetical protein